jgi:hypothetical protein
MLPRNYVIFQYPESVNLYILNTPPRYHIELIYRYQLTFVIFKQR